jgi:hypothetical protein
MLWRNGCDGKSLRCGAGKRHQQYYPPTPTANPAVQWLVAFPINFNKEQGKMSSAKPLGLEWPRLLLITNKGG